MTVQCRFIWPNTHWSTDIMSTIFQLIDQSLWTKWQGHICVSIKHCASKCLSPKSLSIKCLSVKWISIKRRGTERLFFMVGIYKDLLTIILWVNCALSRLWSLHFQFVLCYKGPPVKILNVFLKNKSCFHQTQEQLYIL